MSLPSEELNLIKKTLKRSLKSALDQINSSTSLSPCPEAGKDSKTQHQSKKCPWPTPQPSAKLMKSFWTSSHYPNWAKTSFKVLFTHSKNPTGYNSSRNLEHITFTKSQWAVGQLRKPLTLSTASPRCKALKLISTSLPKPHLLNFLVDTSFDSNKYARSINYSEKIESSKTQFYIGGEPPRTDNIYDWQVKIIDNPMPISHKLFPISDLFNRINDTKFNQTLAIQQF